MNVLILYEDNPERTRLFLVTVPDDDPENVADKLRQCHGQYVNDSETPAEIETILVDWLLPWLGQFTPIFDSQSDKPLALYALPACDLLICTGFLL